MKVDLCEHGGYVAEMLILRERCGFGHSFGLAVSIECGGDKPHAFIHGEE